jgi:hypothetical protein
VIGSQFPYELLHSVDPIPEEELQKALHRLANRDAQVLEIGSALERRLLLGFSYGVPSRCV